MSILIETASSHRLEGILAWIQTTGGVPPAELGISEMMIDVYETFANALTHDMIYMKKAEEENLPRQFIFLRIKV